MTLQLLYRYRPALQQQRYLLLHPLQAQLQVRPIQIDNMSSQPPQILSIEDLNTADAKYVFVLGRHFPPQKQSQTALSSLISYHIISFSFSLTFISEKVGQPEED
jgi:hypothetical protein